MKIETHTLESTAGHDNISQPSLGAGVWSPSSVSDIKAIANKSSSAALPDGLASAGALLGSRASDNPSDRVHMALTPANDNVPPPKVYPLGPSPSG